MTLQASQGLVSCLSPETKSEANLQFAERLAALHKGQQAANSSK